MTDSTKTVFEKHQIRKTRKQKENFREFVKEYAAENGYTCEIEKGICRAKNIVIGNPETAKVVYTAHYDTSPLLPFPNFITPKNIFIYILYQIAILIGILILPISLIYGILKLLGFILASDIPMLLYFPISYLFLIAVLFLLMLGPANKNTANDNTSGVTTLLDIMKALPKESVNDVAFIFFDLEELGLFGSASYASKHGKALINTPIINFDCVSDGQTMIFVLKKDAYAFEEDISTAFTSNEDISVDICKKGVFYPSDQANFKCGIGVAALKCSKNGILYMDRIHTKKDVIYREENIRYLVNGTLKLTEILQNKNTAEVS